jgi:hypothetical protein
MRLRVGSWRDPVVARDVKILAVLAAAVLLVVTVPSGIAWVFLGPIVLGALAALFMAVRGGPRSTLGDGASTAPHPGYNISRVGIAGFPGLVLVVGFVWMFASGLPGLRPVIGGVAAVGVVAGAILIVLERWRKPPSGSVLGLDPGANDEAEDAPRHDAKRA